MASSNTTVDIVDIRVNYQQALTDIATYRSNVEQLKNDQKDLKTQLQSGQITQRQYDEAIAATNINLKNQQDQIRSLSKQVLNQVRTQQQQEGSLQQLRAQLSNLNKEYDGMSRAERNAAKGQDLLVHINKVTTELKKAEEESQRYYRNVGNYPSAFKGLSGMFKNLTGGATSFSGAIGSIASKIGGLAIGITGIGAAVTALANAFKDGVSTAMEFEKQMSTLAAITGGTKDNIKALEEQARALGAATRYTAAEVGSLQTELAKLGYKQQDILNMTTDVLHLSQATGASLADAASLTGATLRMFEDDTTHTQEYVDKMAAATTNSALSFSYLQTAMSTVSPVANAFGFKIEDVLSLLGQLANAGFDASMAATATRNILLNLADANGDLAKQLGKPVTSLKDLTDGLRTLESKGIDLADSLELTDKRSVAAFNTFLKTADGADKLRETLVGADGAAEQMAKTMADNLEGDVKSLGSAWDDFMIEVNDGQGILRTCVQGLTEVVRTVSSTYKDVKTYFTELYDQSEVFRVAVTAIGEVFSDTWGTIKGIFALFFKQLAAAGKMLKGVLTLDWDTFTSGMKQAFDAALQGAGDFALGFAKTMKNVDEAIDQTAANAHDKLQQLRDIRDAAISIHNKLEELRHKYNRDGSQNTTTTTGNGLGLSDEKAAKAAEQAASKAAAEQRKRENNELKAVQAYETELTKLMGSSLEARRAQVNAKYDKEIADLQNTLNQKQNLTATAEEAIKNTITLKEQEREQELEKVYEDSVKKEIEQRVALMQSKLSTMQQKTTEYYDTLRAVEKEEANKNVLEYQSAQEQELQGVEAGSAQELEIRTRYSELIKNARLEMWQNLKQIDIDEQNKQQENRILSMENELAQLEIDGEKYNEARQAIEDMGLDIVTEGEMKILEKEAEIAAQRLANIEEQGRLESETVEKYEARKLAARKAQETAQANLKKASLKNEKAYTASMTSIGNSLISLTDAIGENDEEYAQLSKILTLAQIAFSTGDAIAKGVASASSLPYPANLAAIATTVATVLANIATAISTVNSANFAHGAVGIQGAGTGTSDSIPANISNGESVINAKATKMYAPLLAAINSVGNGAKLPTTIETQSYDDVKRIALQTCEEELTKMLSYVLETRRTQVSDTYTKAIQELQNSLNQKTVVNVTTENAIRDSIDMTKQRKATELQTLNEESIRAEIDKQIETAKSNLDMMQSNTYEYYNSLRAIETKKTSEAISQYEIAKQKELQSVKDNAEKSVEISNRYNQLMENARSIMWENMKQIDIEQQKRLNENRVQALQKELSRIETSKQDDGVTTTNSRRVVDVSKRSSDVDVSKRSSDEAMQAIEKIRQDIVSSNEIMILEQKRDMAAQRLQDITRQGRLKSETQELFLERQTKAQESVQHTETALKDATMRNEAVYKASITSIGNSLVSMSQTNDVNKETYAEILKFLSLARMAYSRGQEIDMRTSSASQSAYTANIATLTNKIAVALARRAFMSRARFATGAVNIVGAGTGTSDSIPAYISNGESVVNAKATQMFAPLLAAINDVGNGISLPYYPSYQNVDNAKLLTDAFIQAVQQIKPVVSVEEINDVNNQVKVIQSLDNL